MTRSALRLPVLLALIALLIAGCGGSGGGQPAQGATEISLVAPSTSEGAFREIIPTFSDSPAGQDIKVKQSYGGAIDQVGKVDGSSDVVALSSEADMERLVQKGLVARDWADNPFEGLVSRSLVTLVVRKDNPKGIKAWDDLAKPGVRVVTPDPATSGAGRWNVAAAYGAQVERGRSTREAEAFVRKLFGNAAAEDASARAARRTFTGGKGDVLITYESEARAAQADDQEVDYVTPSETILVEHPIAVVSKTKNRLEADKLVEYLRDTEAQKVLADQGFRSILPPQVDEDDYPRPKKLFTIDDVGGWAKIGKRFFAGENALGG